MITIPNFDSVSIQSIPSSLLHSGANITITNELRGQQAVQGVEYYAVNSIYSDVFVKTIQHPNSATAQNNVYVTVVNTPPVAYPNTGYVLWNRSVTIQVLTNDQDINPGDKQKLQVFSVNQPSNGVVTNLGAQGVLYLTKILVFFFLLELILLLINVLIHMIHQILQLLLSLLQIMLLLLFLMLLLLLQLLFLF